MTILIRLSGIKKTIFILFFILANFIRTYPQCQHYTRSAIGPLSDYSLAIRDNGTLWGWGYNNFYQLGTGFNGNVYLPIQIGSATNWGTVSSAYRHSLGLTTDGKLWAWGYNGEGQLGDGTFINKNSPVQIGVLINWQSISTGSEHSIAITADGKLWGWGYNSQGQVGDGTTNNQPLCTQIGTATNWIGISTGNSHSMAISNDGKLWAWGLNSAGQLGDNTLINKTAPVQIGTGTNWVAVSGGGAHTLGITADGKLWAWGNNGSGQLGDGTTVSKIVPTQMGNDTWIAISASGTNSMGITSDGRLWSWGYNNWGQIGDGTFDTRNAPLQIGTATNWVAVNSKEFHSFAMNADGQVWAWGYNNLGQLGIGNPPNIQTTPALLAPAVSFTGLAPGNTSKTNYQNSQVFYATDCGNLVARVVQLPAYVNAISGNTTAKVWIEGTPPAQYVKRHYEITAAVNSNTSRGTVTLYFTQSEFDEFNAINVNKLPAFPGDASGISRLLVEKRGGISSDASGHPETYSGTITTIDPADNNIVWNGILNCWEVTFDATGFSGFFIKTTTNILPLNWISVTCGLNAQKHPTVKWKVTEYDVLNYEVQKSSDAINFISIATVNSKGDGENMYSYTDIQPTTELNYFRIKQTARNGRYSYSPVLKLADTQTGIFNVYPNPSKGILSITASADILGKKCKLTDVNGKLLRSFTISHSAFTVNIEQYATGIYFLVFEDGVVERIVKE